MFPYGARGAAVKMAYAKDLSVRVVRRSQTTTVVASVKRDRSGFLEEQRQEESHTIEVESDHGEAVELIVELAKLHGRSLAPESPAPFEETSNYRRLRPTRSRRRSRSSSACRRRAGPRARCGSAT